MRFIYFCIVISYMFFVHFLYFVLYYVLYCFFFYRFIDKFLYIIVILYLLLLFSNYFNENRLCIRSLGVKYTLSKSFLINFFRSVIALSYFHRISSNISAFTINYIFHSVYCDHCWLPNWRRYYSKSFAITCYNYLIYLNTHNISCDKLILNKLIF